MPELPEVETICRGLRARLPGQKVVQIKVLESRLRRPVGRQFRSKLQGRWILDVERRGKYILISLDSELCWLFHLGMSGKLIYVETERPMEKHDHIVASLGNRHELRFHDPRRFGLSLVVSRRDVGSLPELNTLGIDPFDSGFHGAYLYAFTRGSKRRIRDLLIDQRVLAGLGNIYANEILFRAGVRPTARGWKLRRAQIERIAEAAPRLLSEAIRWCGTSFSDYRDAQDQRGEFQNHLRVYDREGESCRVCGSEIKRVPIGNRSAFYCPRCQK